MLAAVFPHKVGGRTFVMPVVDGYLIGQDGAVYLHKDQAFKNGVKFRKAYPNEKDEFRPRLQEYQRQKHRPSPQRHPDFQQMAAAT